MSPYFLVFCGLFVTVGILEYFLSSKPSFKSSKKYTSLRNKYLYGYLLFKLADWLQGPYFYSVYASKGFSNDDIAVLFLTGFLSSAVLGTFVGSLADKIGRVRGCQICGVLFAAACMTTHSSRFAILFLGRVCGGTATSIGEHKREGLEPTTMDNLFALSMLGDGLVAISAGFIAEYAKGIQGFSGPFDVSAGVLVVGTIVVTMLWSENYGNAQIEVFKNFSDACHKVMYTGGTAKVGLASALFEGSMYSFVFMWTKTAQEAASAEGYGDLPLGTIFSCFMAACMMGSRVFVILCKISKVQVFSIGLFALSAISMIPAAYNVSFPLILASFLLFEFCVGVYFPSMGTLRAQYVPNEVRSTIMNMFRIPLNLFVVVLILYSDTIGQYASFISAAIALATGSLLLFTIPPPPNFDKKKTKK